MSMFVNNAFLGDGVKVRVWIREQRSKEDQRHTKPLMTNLDIIQGWLHVYMQKQMYDLIFIKTFYSPCHSCLTLTIGWLA